MRLLIAVGIACSTAAFAADAPPKAVVLVGGYQTLGVDSKQVAELEQALREALGSRPVQLVPQADADKFKKGLGLCGEDAACIGSVGDRAGARWVLGYGAGKVGASALVSLLWIDVLTGKTVATAGSKVAAKALASAAAPLVDELLKNVVLEQPVVVAPPPPPPTPPADAPTTTVLVVAPPAAAPPPVVEKGRPMRTAAIGTGVATGVFAIATVFLGLVAGSNYNDLSSKPLGMDRNNAIARQSAFNTAGDAVLGVTLAAAAATVVFMVMDSAR